MTTIWKPRGPQKPKMMPFEGIRVNHLVQFCKDAQMFMQERGEMDQALTFEIMADYFEKDYKMGTPLRFNPTTIGC